MCVFCAHLLAAAREMASVTVYESLRTLEPLRRGKCDARETAKVMPASEELLNAVRPHLPRPVRAVLELQLLTGARPGELLELRACDIKIDRAASVWRYKPEAHKNASRDRERVIYFGPRSQRILREFLSDRPTDAYLFNPKAAAVEHRAKRHEARRTPLSCGNRPGSNRRTAPARGPGDRYTTSSYHRAIQYACDRAFPPPAPLAKRAKENTADWKKRLVADGLWDELMLWRRSHRFHPHQLRHNCASQLRRLHGLEASALVLGHASAKLTDAVYAERDLARVLEVIRKNG